MAAYREAPHALAAELAVEDRIVRERRQALQVYRAAIAAASVHYVVLPA